MNEPAEAAREDLQATVIGSLPNEMFRLRLQDGREVTAHAAQNLRMAYVRLVAGDVVTIDLSPFDPNKARITKLLKKRIQQQQPTLPVNEPKPTTSRENQP